MTSLATQARPHRIHVLRLTCIGLLISLLFLACQEKTEPPCRVVHPIKTPAFDESQRAIIQLFYEKIALPQIPNFYDYFVQRVVVTDDGSFGVELYTIKSLQSFYAFDTQKKEIYDSRISFDGDMWFKFDKEGKILDMHCSPFAHPETPCVRGDRKKKRAQ